MQINKQTLSAALCYVGPLCLIFFFANSKDGFVNYHTKQGMVLFFVELAVLFINIIPFFGQIIWFWASIVFAAASLVSIIKVLKCEYWKMPFLFKYTKHIKIN